MLTLQDALPPAHEQLLFLKKAKISSYSYLPNPLYSNSGRVFRFYMNFNEIIHTVETVYHSSSLMSYPSTEHGMWHEGTANLKGHHAPSSENSVEQC